MKESEKEKDLDTDFSLFKLIMEWIYCGWIDIEKSQAQGLKELSTKLSVYPVTTLCSKLLNENIEHNYIGGPAHNLSVYHFLFSNY